MSDYLPIRPIWRRTGATSTTPVAIYLPPSVRHLKVWVDALSYFAFGDTYAAPSVTVADEVYTIRTTGTPTGGDFKLTFDGQETAALTFDESAADIITALNALSNVNSGDFVGAGGPLPTDVTLTAGGVYDQAGPLPSLTATSVALTGGTAPTVQIVRSTKGTGTGNTAGGYGYLEAEAQELFDISLNPSRAGGATAQARYLYLATVAAVSGEYRVTGYLIA